MKTITLIISLFLLYNLACGEYRVFKDNAGNIIEAKVVSVEDDVIKIERSDGKEFTIPLIKLSQPDIIYIETTFIKPAEAAKAQQAEDERKQKERYVALERELAEKYPIDEEMNKQEAKEAYQQGFNHLENKDFDKAVIAWASIPKEYDQYAEARRRAGFNVLGRELGYWNQAVIFLLAAHEADPKNENILEDLGRAYQRLDNYENAKYFLSRAKTKTAKAAIKEIEVVESD